MSTIEELIEAQVRECEFLERSFTNRKKKAAHKTRGFLKSFFQNLEEKWDTLQTRHKTILRSVKKEHLELLYFTEEGYDSFETRFLMERGKYLDALDSVNADQAGSSTQLAASC